MLQGGLWQYLAVQSRVSAERYHGLAECSDAMTSKSVNCREPLFFGNLQEPQEFLAGLCRFATHAITPRTSYPPLCLGTIGLLSFDSTLSIARFASFVKVREFEFHDAAPLGIGSIIEMRSSLVKPCPSGSSAVAFAIPSIPGER